MGSPPLRIRLKDTDYNFIYIFGTVQTGALARDLLNECARKQGVVLAPASGRLKLREN